MAETESAPRRETYAIGTDTYVKEYRAGERVRFLVNGEAVELADWNRRLNRFQSMALKEHHPNPLIRLKERQRRAGFLHFVDARPGEEVADVGCESGYLAVALAARGCRMWCVDIDPRLLDLARERIGDGARYVVSDICAIDLPDASVDVAVASEILEHLPDPSRGIAELIRITRPGGRVFVSIPNERLVLLLKAGIRRLGLRRVLGALSDTLAIGHVHVLGRKELVALCAVPGLEMDRIIRSKPFFLNVFARLRRSSA